MLRSLFGGEDPVKNATNTSNVAAGQHAAKTADSRRIRAASAAGRDRRSIGVTRREFGR